MRGFQEYESIDYRSIEASNKKLSMDYRSIDYNGLVDDSSPSQLKQRAIAEHLLRRLQEPSSWKFYLKCAYHLSEARIWELVELSCRPMVKNPNRYFVYLANKEMSI